VTNDKDSGHFIGHFPCFNCGSSDSLALYRQEDKTYNGHCFSNCGFVPATEIEENFEVDSLDKYKKVSDSPKITPEELQEVQSKQLRGWKERRIPKQAAERYGVYTEGTPEEPTKRFYPRTVDDEIVGYKIRFVENKDFGKVGYGKSNCQFFGQAQFPSGGKFLAIAEGEEDAQALWSALKTPKYETPVISPTDGAGSIKKQLKQNYDYVNSFDKVVLFLDNDEPGQKATQEICKILPQGKVYIADMKLASPDEYTRRGKEAELRKLFWDAEPYSPIDVTSLGQLWKEFESAGEEEIIPLPEALSELARMMGGGPAQGEVTVLGALTSIGKTTILMSIIYHLMMNTDKRSGLMLLEATAREIIRGLLSIYMEENLALNNHHDMKFLKKKFDELIGNDDKVINVNHNGAFKTVDEMFAKIEWLAKVAGCDVIFIDPLQAAVPNNENGVIDEFMDSLLKLAKQTNVHIFVVSHMKKPPEDKPHAVSEYNLKGSSSINQIAFNTILFSRDKLSDNPDIKNSTKITMVKCRRTGVTGDAGWLKYNPESALLEAGENPYLDDVFQDLSVEDHEAKKEVKKQVEDDDVPPWDFEKPED